jgi:1-phosphofructokinase
MVWTRFAGSSNGCTSGGANRVDVSRAGAGAIASDGRAMHDIRPLRLEVADPRGAGDSMAAALAVGLSRGPSWEATLRLAAAASAVNLTRHGSGSALVAAGFAMLTAIDAIRMVPGLTVARRGLGDELAA